LQLSSVGGRPLMQSSMGAQGSVVPTIKLTNQNKAPPGKVAIPTITAGEVLKRPQPKSQSLAPQPKGIFCIWWW
jgi:hypothetical protein